jgi:hypothetical protein
LVLSRADSSADAILSPEDGENIFLRNVGIYRRVYTAPKPTRTASSTHFKISWSSNLSFCQVAGKYLSVSKGFAVQLSSVQISGITRKNVVFPCKRKISDDMIKHLCLEYGLIGL